MKNTFFLIIICSLLFSACSSENIIGETNNQDLKNDDIQQKELLLVSVDSLNYAYLNGNITRFSPWKFMGGQFADWIGKKVGEKVGSYVGCAAGTAAGSPVVGVVGYVAGRRVGGLLCSAIVSYVVCQLTDEAVIDKKESDIINGPIVPSDETQKLNVDSLGIYHNKIMWSMALNKENQYVDAEINYERVYADCIACLEENGVSNDSIFSNSDIRREIISYAQDIVMYAKKHDKGNREVDDFIGYEKNILKTRYDFSKDEIEFTFNFGEKVANASENVNLDDINEYAEKLGDLIRKTSLSEEEKRQMIDDANILISSTLYWYR